MVSQVVVSRIRLNHLTSDHEKKSPMLAIDWGICTNWHKTRAKTSVRLCIVRVRVYQCFARDSKQTFETDGKSILFQGSSSLSPSHSTSEIVCSWKRILKPSFFLPAVRLLEDH